MPLPILDGVDARVRAAFTFGQIVCAVNKSSGGDDALHQAIQLVGSLDTLTFVAVADARGEGSTGLGKLNEEDAVMAVEAARAAAHADGIEATAVIARAQDVSHAIMQAARDAGLLVVGAHDRLPVAGTLLGSTTSRAMHSALMPVLVARARPVLGFPGIVVVGTRGIEDRHAALAGATIADRHGTRVVLAHAGRSDPGLRRALAEQAADVLGITGHDPVVVSVGGPPVDRLPAMAGSVGAGLVVLGSHGRRGPAPLAGLSERVAHRASCSVLVLRGAENYGSEPDDHGTPDVADPDGSHPHTGSN